MGYSPVFTNQSIISTARLFSSSIRPSSRPTTAVNATSVAKLTLDSLLSDVQRSFAEGRRLPPLESDIYPTGQAKPGGQVRALYNHISTTVATNENGPVGIGQEGGRYRFATHPAGRPGTGT